MICKSKILKVWNNLKTKRKTLLIIHVTQITWLFITHTNLNIDIAMIYSTSAQIFHLKKGVTWLYIGNRVQIYDKLSDQSSE